MTERMDRQLLLLLAAIITTSFILGWLGVRKAETLILRKEVQEIALKWSHSLIKNLEDVERLVRTGELSEHDRILLKLATMAGGIIRHKVYNSDSKVVAATNPGEIGQKNTSPYFRNIVRAGQTFVEISDATDDNDASKFIVSAYVPYMSDEGFKGAFEVYLDEKPWAVHTRKIGNYAISGLFLTLASISTFGGVLILRNIQYRRKKEEELNKAWNEAETANRMKSQFLANMSHELRTPINAISGFSEVISGEYFGPIEPKKYRDYAKDIHDSSQHLLSLINDILDLSKAESGKMEIHKEIVMVPDIVKRCLRLVQDSAQNSGVILSAEASEELPVLFADKRYLLQILLNFLSNAIKFTPRNGKVTISATLTNTRYFRLTVEDTGIGIHQEDIQKVFEPFFQAANSYEKIHQGTGLGLPLTKHLIELHGGYIELTSEVGLGTIVSAYFPSDNLIPTPDG